MNSTSFWFLSQENNNEEWQPPMHVIAMNAIKAPDWMIHLHIWRRDLFLKYVEPCIVWLLGPAAGENPDHYFTDGNQHEEDPSRQLGFLPNYVEDASAFRETSMSFATLTMLFTIMTCLLIVFLSCFYHNQKTAPLFASPRRHRLPNLVPPPLPVDGTFSWIKVCFYMSDEEIIGRVGFDSLIFIRFHRLALRCILKMSVFSFLVLLPINFSGGGHANASDLKGYVGSLLFTDFLRFTMANVTGGSPTLWVHCVAAYLLSAIIMRELVVEYNAFNNIRHRYMLSKEPHLRTVLVTNIPTHLRSPKKIRNYFKHVYPNAVKNVTMCQNLLTLEKMVAIRNNVISMIEQEVLNLCRDEKRKLTKTMSLTSTIKTITSAPFACFENMGLVDVVSDRMVQLNRRLEQLNSQIRDELERRNRIMRKLDKMDSSIGNKDIDYMLATPFGDAESQSTASGASTAGTIHRRNTANTRNSDFDYVNFVDDDSSEQENESQKYHPRPFAKAKHAIKRYSRSVFDAALLGHSNASKRHAQKHAIENHVNEVTDKAFVEMKTFTASTIAIQSMHSSKPGAMDVKTAPEPRDILWQNIYVTKGAKKTRSYIAETVIILLISFYVVPVALISLLVSESALISISPRLAQLDQASPFFSSAIALAQPICLVIIQQLLPPLFMQIAKAEGTISFSEAQMNTFSRYFMFQVLNVFLVTAIAGSIFDTIAIIIENPEAAFEMLGNSLPRMSSFFITLVTMKTFLGLGVELVRALHIVQNILRYPLLRNATLRQKKRVVIGLRAIDDPGWFPYHKILAQDMLVVVISVVFAVIAPIVLLPCALFCLFSRIMWTHHHLYVFESVFESGGQFFPKIFRRFVFGLIIAQMTITGQFILKEARHEAYATIALMFITYIFLRSTRSKYDAPSSTLPLEVATIMDITVAQEKEAKRNQSTELMEETNKDVTTANDNDFSFADFNPFEHAYCQPALRANPDAKPEQPFPPSQLGQEEEVFVDNPQLMSQGTSSIENNNTGGLGDKATVRLKSLNHRDRIVLNHWWKQQLEASGKQALFSVLLGQKSGTLRLGRKIQRGE